MEADHYLSGPSSHLLPFSFYLFQVMTCFVVCAENSKERLVSSPISSHLRNRAGSLAFNKTLRTNNVGRTVSGLGYDIELTKREVSGLIETWTPSGVSMDLKDRFGSEFDWNDLSVTHRMGARRSIRSEVVRPRKSGAWSSRRLNRLVQ